MEIEHKVTGKVLFSSEKKTLKEVVIEAVEKKADLRESIPQGSIPQGSIPQGDKNHRKRKRSNHQRTQMGDNEITEE